MNSTHAVRRRELDVILKFLWRNLFLRKNDPQVRLVDVEGRCVFDTFSESGSPQPELVSYLQSNGLINSMVYTYEFTLPNPPTPTEIGKVMETAYNEFRQNLDQVLNAAVSNDDAETSRT